MACLSWHSGMAVARPAERQQRFCNGVPGADGRVALADVGVTVQQLMPRWRVR